MPKGMGRCKACKKVVRWCVVDGTMRTIPIDWEPDPERGNVVLTNRHTDDGRQLCHVYGNQGLALAALTTAGFPDRPRYVTHFVTCPKAGDFRKAHRPANGA